MKSAISTLEQARVYGLETSFNRFRIKEFNHVARITFEIDPDSRFSSQAIALKEVWYRIGSQTKHRVGGPATTYVYTKTGEIFCEDWYLDGASHREGGPAVEYANGDKHWYKHGYRHRDDGPAVILANGKEKWFRNDKPYTPTAHDLMLWNLKKNQG